jgi:multidrug efflux pump subunit AcrB
LAHPPQEPGQGLIAYFARHRTLPNLILVVITVAGLAAMSRIRAQYFPDVVQAEVTVQVAWAGAGAEDVDRGIVQVLEPALLAINGVADVTSRATEGSARISLEFEPGADVGQATEDVQAVVDATRDLPEAADDPVVRRGAWRDQVTDVVITGPVAPDQLGRFADEFTARLFAAGITRTTIQGLAAPRIVVEVPTVNLMRHDVTMAEVADAIAGATRAEPAGDMGGTARLRSGDEARLPAEIAAIPLRSDPGGARLTVGDVGSVLTEGASGDRAAFVGADPAMTIRVDRADQGDSVRMQAQVAEVAAEVQKTLPEGVTIRLVNTRAEQISDRISLLLSNGIMGLCLVLGFLFLFLNAKTAIWVAAGIPVSMLAAIAVMYALGMTLNMISLFALIITLGIIVDDAIVVAEHADYRARVLGEPAQIAAERAATRMALPVMASTITTIIAFAGLVAVGGRFGAIIADIPWTVTLVLVASTVECFLVLPRHMAGALATLRDDAWYDWPSRQVLRGFAWVQVHLVRPAVTFILRARYAVLAGAVFLLCTQVAVFLRGDIQFRFFNAPEQSTVTGNFSMLPGAGRADTQAMMAELQRAAEVVAGQFDTADGAAPVTAVIAQIGAGFGRGLSGAEDKDADLLGGISISVIDRDLRDWSIQDFAAAMQEEVRPAPLMEELSFRGGRYGPGGNGISVDLSGADAATLKSAAEAVKTALAPFPEVSGLEDTLAYDKQELILTLSPQGAALGFSIDALGKSLRDMLGGIEAASFPDGPRSATVRVELPKSELTADFLDRTLMRAGPGVYVPLADLVEVTQRSGFSSILRENGARVVTVSGDLNEDDPARAAEVQRVLSEDILPRITAQFGVEQRLSGLAEQQSEFLGDAVWGLIFALGGIYLCLALVFQRWLQPLVVMSVIPFGLVGAIWGHVHWDMALSLFSIVGLIGMTGIIVNDAIVLIDTVNDYSRKRALGPAIVDAVTDRLRPVMLTTLTTILGLAPLLYERSAQAEFLKPTVISLVYGLGFGLVLVLVVVPAILAIQADVARQFTALRRIIRGRRRVARRLARR